MKNEVASRRVFAQTGAALAASSLVRGQERGSGLTPRQAIERIQKNIGVPWRNETVDTFKAGNPDTRLKGIATTFMSTFDVLQRAVAGGKNLVITHEPTFWAHDDKTEALTEDPLYKAKAEFIKQNDMVVWRFHDHWHMRKPDGIATGMVEELGWEKNVNPENPRLFDFPSESLAAFARSIQDKLKIRTMRVIGDPAMKVSRAAGSWGFTSPMANRLLARPEVDVLVIGEAREWEVIPYVQDLIASGKKKGLIILGHAVSEDAGMKYCATWLKTFISEVPIEFVPAGEPFWNPNAPPQSRKL